MWLIVSPSILDGFILYKMWLENLLKLKSELIHQCMLCKLDIEK